MNITQNIYNALQLQYSIGRGKGVHSIPPPSRLCAAKIQSHFKPAFNKEESKIVYLPRGGPEPFKQIQLPVEHVTIIYNVIRWPLHRYANT